MFYPRSGVKIKETEGRKNEIFRFTGLLEHDAPLPFYARSSFEDTSPLIRDVIFK